MLTQCKVLLLMMENLSSKLNHDEILSLVGGNCDRTAKLNSLIKRNDHHLNASGALA